MAFPTAALRDLYLYSPPNPELLLDDLYLYSLSRPHTCALMPCICIHCPTPPPASLAQPLITGFYIHCKSLLKFTWSPRPRADSYCALIRLRCPLFQGGEGVSQEYGPQDYKTGGPTVWLAMRPRWLARKHSRGTK